MSRFQCLTVLTVVAVLSAGLVAQDQASRTGLVRGSQVIGMEIRNADNQNIGKIEDVVLDKDAGTIAFAIVSFSPEMNAGEKLFVLPWVHLKRASDAKSLMADLPKDRLEKAPSFPKDAWPDMNAQWSSEVLSFYGARPLPARETTVRDDRARATGENGNRDMPRQARDVRVVTGRIGSFTQGDPSHLVIASSTGDTRAELAPSTFLDQHRLVFDNNADITVRGYELTRDGSRTFIVTEVTKDGRTVKLRGDDFAPLWTSNRTALERSPDHLANAYDLVDLTGTVTYLEGSGVCDESPQGRLVTIRTAQGDRVVALGPGHYLSRNRFDFRPAETVSVKGYEADYQGRRMFFATEVRRGDNVLKLRRADGTPLW